MNRLSRCQHHRPDGCSPTMGCLFALDGGSGRRGRVLPHLWPGHGGWTPEIWLGQDIPVARGVRLMRRHRLPASVRAERVMSFPEEGAHPGPGSAGSSAIPPGERRPSSRRGATPDSKDSRRSSARHSPMPVTCPSSPCPCGPAARVMRSPGKRPSPASWSVSSSPSTPGATCGPVPAGAGTAGRGDVAPAAIDATRAARYRRPSRRRVHGPLGTAVAP